LVSEIGKIPRKMQIGGYLRKSLLGTLISCLFIALVCAAAEDSPGRKYYANRKFEFCVQRPANWSLSESFTRNGATMAPGNVTAFSRPPRITVGAHMNQPNQSGSEPQTLDENVQAIVDSLKEYGAAQDVQVLKKDGLTLQGLRAQAITLKFTDKSSENQWFQKDVNLIDQANTVYFVELKCHPKDAGVLEPVFDELVQSLRIRCNNKTRPE